MSEEKDKPTPKSIEEILKLIARGETLTETQQKQMNDYKFWKTQPVPRLDEAIDSEGPINGTLTPADIPDEPLPLLDSFEWSDVDLDSEAEVEELYQLLYEHYVEDRDATFRFKYSHEFFKWGLKPPGWRKEWHVGVRIKETGKLVAFIGAIPITLKLNKSGKLIPSVEINFLCIHKKLRSKRLTPVLIKEITRRVNKVDIWQALYTAGIILPSPVSTCRYTHRPINWSKLHDVGFSHLPPDKTKSSMAAHYALPNSTSTKGLRPMEKRDVQQTFDLFNKFQEKFDIVQIFELEEFEHWLLGGQSSDVASKVIKTYVVENEDGKITDFFSYYLLPFTVLDNPDHSELGIAYLYYYASDTSGSDQYKLRLNSLINDALITSKQFNVDVFNCVTSQDNTYFIKDAKFGSGDGFLNYYLFNYKTWPVHGGIDKQSKEVVDDQTSGVGVVML
ncbi:Glycylpeptide N-tetradecanoyltransferase [Suhomyces tanzawaensis NRRL Y-17324]|uniref:Glycylpeptide N-tetradecanoyltransferase n=1 Tax=Suhomyces tanzawaensis NRRL Y-17324 TaxID=984487 RepID=A0A1E4SQD4_9ASCO|nr:Glycylpeptide N-tetradecanoyltransferase [Suhomyces tanzawaensis NRRL Y-17324]ODV81723.1 Glycylpeptide N-tetradecanoyltransferase [Suhomyces tanzawaensis NRRL Y-17324]